MITLSLINNFLVYLIDILGFFLAIWVFLNNKKEKANKVFSFFIISILSWITFYHFAVISGDKETSLVLFRISGGLVFLFFILYYYFVILFTKGNKFYEQLGKLIIIYGLVFSFLTIFTDLIIKNSIVEPWGVFPDFSLFGQITFYGYVILLTFLINKIFIAKYIFSTKIEKIRIQYFLTGFILFAVLNFIFDVLLPVFFKNYQFFWVWNYSTFFLIVLTAYAIIKHELMGIKTLLTQVLITAISFILLADTFFLSDNPTMQLLKLGILLAFLYFSREMVKSAKKEKEAREAIEKINKYLGEKTQDMESLLSLNKMISLGVEIEKSVQNIMDAVPEKLGHLGIMGTFLIRYDEGSGKACAYVTTESDKIRQARCLLSKPELSDYSLIVDKKDSKNCGLVIKSILNNEIEKGSNIADFVCPPLDKPTSILIQEKLGGKTFVSVPMTIRGEKKGALIFIFTKEIAKVSPRDLDLINAFTQHVSVVMDNLQFYKSLNKNIEELTSAKDKLKEALDIKNDFLHIVSHQLRTPLTVMRGFITMWNAKDFSNATSEKKAEIRERIVSNTERLNNIVNDMVTAMESEGEMKLNFQPIDIWKMLQENIEMLNPNFKKKNLYLKYKKVSKNIPKIEADKKLLHNVFVNLIDNAEKYTAEGGLTIKVKYEKDNVNICFIDTGIGLSEDDKKILFQKFSRGKKSNYINPNGSGLGLFIAKQIIAKHNGKIKVTSEGEGKGSIFTVILPVRQGK